MTGNLFWSRWARAALAVAWVGVSVWSTAAVSPWWAWALAAAVPVLAGLVFYWLGRKVVGILIAVFVAPVLWLFETRTHHVHGSARWQSGREMKRGNLAGNNPIFLGQWTDWLGRTRNLTSTGTEHVLIVGSSRSGKGVSVLVPSLLSWKHSVVCYDEKQELSRLTAAWREREAGNSVFRFDPANPGDDADAFNFLDGIRLGTEFEVADSMNIAAVLVDDPSNGEMAHWTETGRELLAGVALYCLGYDPEASLASCAEALTNGAVLFEAMAASTNAFVAGCGRAQLDRGERERSSVTSTASRALSIFRDPVVARSTNRSTFALADLADEEKPASLYIVVGAADVVRLRPLVKLMFTAVTLHLMTAMLRFDDAGRQLAAHKHPVLLVLDEFASLGKMEIVEQALARCLGYGVSALIATQDISQLYRAYGEHQAITANTNLRICFPPNEVATAEWISKQLGTTTVSTRMVSTGSSSHSSRSGGEGGGSSGGGSSTSISYQLTARQLLLADEILSLPKVRRGANGETLPGAVIIIEAGRRAVLARQLFYFTDEEMTRRALGRELGEAERQAKPFAVNDDWRVPATTGGVAAVGMAAVVALVLIGASTPSPGINLASMPSAFFGSGPAAVFNPPPAAPAPWKLDGATCWNDYHAFGLRPAPGSFVGQACQGVIQIPPAVPIARPQPNTNAGSFTPAFVVPPIPHLANHPSN